MLYLIYAPDILISKITGCYIKYKIKGTGYNIQRLYRFLYKTKGIVYNILHEIKSTGYSVELNYRFLDEI